MAIDIYILMIIITLYIVNRFLFLKSDKKDEIFLVMAFISLFIILAIRKPISDMGNYFEYFHYINNASFEKILNFKLEILYKVLNFVIGHIWENETFFMVIIDIITSIGVYFYIKRYSNNYLLSIILFVVVGTYYMQFFILRQAIAISIILLSIRYIEKKKLIKFTLCVVIAALFHKSSIIFLIAYPICNCKITKQYIMIWTFICMILFVSKKYIVEFVSRFWYKQYNSSVISGEGYFRLFVLIAILVISFILSQYSKKNEGINDEKDYMKIFYNLMFITIAIQILATQQSIICRLANTFCMGSIILLPNSIQMIKNKKIKNSITLSLIIICLLYSVITPNITNYLTFFS